MSDKKLSLKARIKKLGASLKQLGRYSVVAFLIFVDGLYGFVLLRAASLSKTEPSDTAVTSQVKAAQVPHIDESTVRQIKSLQDNSVSVQALFDEARSNPFQ